MGVSVNASLSYGVDFGEINPINQAFEDYDSDYGELIDRAFIDYFDLEKPEWPSHLDYPERRDFYDEDDPNWKEKYEKAQKEFNNHPDYIEYKDKREKLKDKKNQVSAEVDYYGHYEHHNYIIIHTKSKIGAYWINNGVDVGSLDEEPVNAEESIRKFCEIIGVDISEKEICWHLMGEFSH